ncbi:hypothetical protein TRVL_10326 [Trypanosoma vivax]|uniref:Uncharacterized protein n=1 Tax=Trypanosoma vivax (strain Y486) TaxID=1055687 RepID=G0UA70_TRYVY|nr:hypothetical protein TRVL_10326 [Trypanosoma vivax]CCC52702.1 conserved hypothetical protein [Trypanosoma vivax Y486]
MRCGAMCSGHWGRVRASVGRILELARRIPERWRGPVSFLKRRLNLRRFLWCPSPLWKGRPPGREGALLCGRGAKTTATIMKPRRRFSMCRAIWALSFGEVAAVFDLKASFFQVSLPQESRASFCCRAEAGRLVGLAALPMGFKCGPEMLHTAARVLAGDPAAASSRYASPRSLKKRIWNDNIRISGAWKSWAVL